MPQPPQPWYDRLLDRLPPAPGWLLPVCLLGGLVLLGVIIGALWCAHQDLDRGLTRTTVTIQDATIRLKLDALEQRLKALEEHRP
jgi:hypothetical protein